TLAGHGRLVMLAGEPGIGKTRIAQELAFRADAQGVVVLWGRCVDEEGAPPYWPWIQPLRAYIQQAGAEQLSVEMGRGAATIAGIVAELRDKLPGLETPPDLEPEAARFRLFDSISTFLKNASQSQPIMLVLDDLHWADRSSLLLLQFLAPEIAGSSLLVIGTYRDVELSRQHPLSETLAQLSRSAGGRFQRVLLRGLDQENTGLLIQAGAGIEPTTGLVEALYAHTEGNPFFMTEVIKLLSESGELTPERIGGGLRIPEGVREVIGQRLNRLSEQCNEVLTTASVVGREFDFNLLSRLSGEGTEDRVLEALEEALAARVIEEPPGTTGRYQFTHALIQESLAQELSTTRRARLHARIGQALEELYGAIAQAHAAELAHHFAEAELVLGPTNLVLYSLLAGEQALASHAYEDALAHFERGLGARDITLSGTEVAPDEEAAALLFGRARAQTATFVGHQLVEVFLTLSRAFEYYCESGNVSMAAAAAEFPFNSPAVRIPGVAELMARALTLVPADSHEAGRLLSRYGGILGAVEGNYEGAQQALGRAMTVARRERDAPLEVQTLSFAALVSGIHLHWQESADNGQRAIELAIGDENPFSDLISRYWIALSLLQLGDLDGARPHALAVRDVAERRSTPRQIASNGFMPITYLSCLEGAWNAAREYSDQGLEVSPVNSQLLLPRVLLEYETGESAQGEVYLERLLGEMRRAGPDQPDPFARVSMAIAGIARITNTRDRLETAGAAAEEALSAQSVTPLVAIYVKTGLALLAVQKGDGMAAAEHYEYLLGQRGTMIWTFSSVDRLLGLLCQTMGNLDQSVGHFVDAIAFCRKAGYKPELAWSYCDYADVLQERNDPVDNAKAVALLNESLAISTELGMPPLMERVTERLDWIQAQPPPAPSYPSGLSQREVEVLRLVAAGKTDREIAEELIISFRTVGNHVRNILNKTNTSNRTEAATFAAHQGLT
ncbi:MAG: AAA family ATPase, partial [Stenotrophomonas maltophilia]